MRISDGSSDVCSSDLAQFRARRVCVHHCANSAEITMRVELTSDSGLELDLAYGNAYALLEALGVDAESVGEIALSQLRERIAAPATSRRAMPFVVEQYLPLLHRLAGSAEEMDEARHDWESG